MNSSSLLFSNLVRFNYRYPVRGRKRDEVRLIVILVCRFNYRYPVRGRKRDEVGLIVILITDLITVTPQGDEERL